MSNEQIKVFEELGRGLAIMYINALDESGSSEIANNIVRQFLKAQLNQDSIKLYM